MGHDMSISTPGSTKGKKPGVCEFLNLFFQILLVNMLCSRKKMGHRDILVDIDPSVCMKLNVMRSISGFMTVHAPGAIMASGNFFCSIARTCTGDVLSYAWACWDIEPKSVVHVTGWVVAGILSASKFNNQFLLPGHHNFITHRNEYIFNMLNYLRLRMKGPRVGL